MTHRRWPFSNGRNAPKDFSDLERWHVCVVLRCTLTGLDATEMSCNLLARYATKLNKLAVGPPGRGRDLPPPRDRQ